MNTELRYVVRLHDPGPEGGPVDIVVDDLIPCVAGRLGNMDMFQGIYGQAGIESLSLSNVSSKFLFSVVVIVFSLLLTVLCERTRPV